MLARITTIGLLTIVAVYSSGCASIVSRSRWPVSIRSSPSNAAIRVVNAKGVEVYNGTTPASVDLKSSGGFFKRARYVVHYNLPGFADHMEVIDFKLNGWYWGNLVFGGFIGFLIVDPATGAMYKVRNPTINALLEEKTSMSGEPSLRIIDINEIPVDLRADLELLR